MPIIAKSTKDLLYLVKQMKSKDINVHLKLLQVYQNSGDLVNRGIVEAVIKKQNGELCRRLNNCTRQIVNIAGAGKTRDEKMALAKSITTLIDATLREYRENFVIPKPAALSIDTAERRTYSISKAVKEVKRG